MQSYILVTRKAVWVTLARWLRRMLRLGVAALVLGIQSVPAIACSIVDMTPSDQPMRGANCSYYHIATTIRAVGLSEAVDLGGGFVIQHATDGNACYREWNIVVHDCNARSLVVVGPARDDYGPEQAEVPMYDIFNRIESDAAAGHPMSLAALTSLADSYGYAGTLRTAVGTRLSINGYNVPSDCACDTFYPGLGGG